MEGRTRILTLKNGYHAWTRCVGTGPMPILLLHGGPGGDHEYLECLAERLPLDRYRLYFYDQLGSYRSDQPEDRSLWSVERFLEEVEEVRQGLGLDRMVLFGHSWGGMLGIEYALSYPDHLAGLVISNMVPSIASYTEHLNELREALPPELQSQLAAYESRGDYQHPQYLKVVERLNQEHLCRLDPLPVAVARSLGRLNVEVYETLQGPNEFVVTGRFKDWDRWADLPRIRVPALILGAQYDTMDAQALVLMSQRMPLATCAICPNGGHMAMWDDPEHYYPPLLRYLEGLRPF